MSTRAEAKYRVSAEDKSGQAFQSFKRNVTTANETVEKLRSSVRLAGIALGVGGLVRSITGAIRAGADLDVTLAGADAAMRRAGGAADQLRARLAEGVAPAVALVADGIANLARDLDRAGGRGSNWADDAFGGLLSAANIGPYATPWAAALKAKRAELDLTGAAILAARAEEENFKRAFTLRESLRGAQDKLNDAVGEYLFLQRQGMLAEHEVAALIAKRRGELFPALPAVTIPRDNAFLLEVADEFAMYSDEWHDQLVGALTPSTEDWPAAKGKWELFFGGIQAAATEASEGMERAFTDALFDMERAGDHLLAYLTQVFKAISDAMLSQYVTGPLLQAIGLGGGGGASTVYSSPIGPTPGGEPMGNNKALPGGGGTVNVNIHAIDSRSGLEFLVGHKREIATLVRLDAAQRYR